MWVWSGELPLIPGSLPLAAMERTDGRVLMEGNRVLESLKAGVRLPEARFANLSVASKGQRSVLGTFSRPRDGEARPSPG